MHSHQAEQHNPSLNSWTTKEIEDTIWMFEEIAETQAQMKFSVFGSSTLPLPTFLQRNIQKVISSASAADYQYADLDGRADLIESIIKNFPEVQNYQTPTRQVKSSNILITMGALNGIHAAIEALCSPGDEIIVFEPVYQNHLVSFIRAGIVFKGVNMIFDSQKQRFEFDYKSLKEALSPKTKIILIVNPNNPATRVFTEEEFIKISEIIQDYPDVTVIEDQAYFLYHTDSHKPVPFATVKPENFDKTITFYSAGKMFNTTGTRVGFSIGAEKISKKVREWMQYKSHFTPAFEQMVVREHLLAATEKDENSRDFYEATRIDICAKQKLITEELAKCGVKVLPCEGTYYMIIDVENLRGRVEEKYYFKLHDPKTRTEGFDQAFCRKMLVEHAVGLLAYSPLFSGKNSPDNFVRVAANRNEDDLKILFDAFRVFMK